MNANIINTEEQTKGLQIENEYKAEKEYNETENLKKEGYKTDKEIEQIEWENKLKRIDYKYLERMKKYEIEELALKLEREAQAKGIEWTTFTADMVQKGFKYNAKKNIWEWNRMRAVNQASAKQGRLFNSFKIK